jgi:hypothetical protein
MIATVCPLPAARAEDPGKPSAMAALASAED